jgi:putative ABC transport system permease protein
VHRDYHQALGIPLLAGSYFGLEDGEDAPLTVVINEWAAQHFWPDETPIGKTISMPWGDTLVAQVAGVVGNVRHDGPSSIVRSQLYWEHRQFQPWSQMTIFARSETDPTSLASSIRRIIAEVDPNVPLYNIRTVDSYLGQNLAQARLSMLALGFFSVVALLLASVGIYGVISFAVSERSRDIGIRMALGASAEAVTGQVVRSGAKLIGIAVVLGLAASLALSRLLQSMVFEVSTSDPTTLIAVTLLLSAVAVAACYFPARRAGKVDIVEVLRRE